MWWKRKRPVASTADRNPQTEPDLLEVDQRIKMRTEHLTQKMDCLSKWWAVSSVVGSVLITVGVGLLGYGVWRNASFEKKYDSIIKDLEKESRKAKESIDVNSNFATEDAEFSTSSRGFGLKLGVTIAIVSVIAIILPACLFTLYIVAGILSGSGILPVRIEFPEQGLSALFISTLVTMVGVLVTVAYLVTVYSVDNRVAVAIDSAKQNRKMRGEIEKMREEFKEIQRLQE